MQRTDRDDVQELVERARGTSSLWMDENAGDGGSNSIWNVRHKSCILRHEGPARVRWLCHEHLNVDVNSLIRFRFPIVENTLSVAKNRRIELYATANARLRDYYDFLLDPLEHASVFHPAISPEIQDTDRSDNISIENRFTSAVEEPPQIPFENEHIGLCDSNFTIEEGVCTARQSTRNVNRSGLGSKSSLLNKCIRTMFLEFESRYLETGTDSKDTVTAFSMRGVQGSMIHIRPSSILRFSCLAVAFGNTKWRCHASIVIILINKDDDTCSYHCTCSDFRSSGLCMHRDALVLDKEIHLKIKSFLIRTTIVSTAERHHTLW